MADDIRFSVNFWQHPKTVKLSRKGGLEAVRSLQILWCFCAQERTDGILSGMDEDDIEIAADWQGKTGKLLELLLTGNWLERMDDGAYALHGWEERQAYVSKTENRKAQAKAAAEKRWRHKRGMPVAMPDDAPSNADECEQHCSPQNGHMLPHAERNAPLPDPDPKKKEEDLKPHGRSENEDPARDTRSSQVGLGEEEADPHGESTEKLPSADPSVEFQELRVWYSEHCRPEGPLVGFTEFKQAKAARTWPGQTRIYDDLTARSASDKWQRGYAPSLATYLRTWGWKAPPEAEAKARASPLGPRAMTVRDAETLERNQRAKMLLAARAAREERHAQADGDAGAFDLAGAALPAGAVHERRTQGPGSGLG